MRKYDAVIFDMDGTLVDSLQSDVESLARCARKFGLPPVPRETSLRLFGLSNMDFYRVVFPDAGETVYERVRACSCRCNRKSRGRWASACSSRA